MTPYELITKKRDGQALTKNEIEFFIENYVNGQIKDYQMSALLMAIFFNGMQDEEIFALTSSYLNSGEVLDLSNVSGVKVDKHSTGGVGDKVSIILAPMAAVLGVPVPMISGRGLGHTGGTLDKLEAIPGFQVFGDSASFKKQLQETGVAMLGQTKEVVPADRLIYALRDVTATVESIPLITASIMSKKIAEGIDGLVLDVKYGNGAFMSNIARAEELANYLIKVGKAFDKKVVAYLTSMEQPLGLKIGNWLEIEECIDCLKGGGPKDLLDVTLTLTGEMLVIGGIASNLEEAKLMCQETLHNGSAYKKLIEMAEYQGGDVKFIHEPEKYPRAKTIKTVLSPESGYITGFDTKGIGLASVHLGAGRSKAEDPVDAQAGIVLKAKLGDYLEKGQELCEIHTNLSGVVEDATQRILKAISIGEAAPVIPELILKRIV